jgi:uncharacterized protein (TIGR02996 family)
MLSLRDALESALVENPDDLATHYAYADFLQEQGDPRGEFIQVQLALEDPDRTTTERQKLQQRERELLAEHGRKWLGVLADELLGPAEEPWELLDEHDIRRPYEFRFARGWLDRIVTLVSTGWGHRLGMLLCTAPESQLLRLLHLAPDDGVIQQLIRSPFLNNLRVLRVSGGVDWLDEFEFRELSKLVEKLPRLEELCLFARNYDAARLFSLDNLRHLRSLTVYHLDAPYPLEMLADNPTLRNLTHLLLAPGNLEPDTSPNPLIDLAGVRAVIQSQHLRGLTHLLLHRSNLGDVGCTEIVTSGILKRLKVLDLRRGEITDAGASILADCPDLRRLESLDIERNALTQAGIDALRRVLGPALRGDNQQTAEELTERRYLYEDDFA